MDEGLKAMRDWRARVAAAREAEAGRIAEVRATGYVPEACGPEIGEAPARGPVRMFEPRATYPDGKDGYVIRPSGYRGRKALHLADQFDQARVSARRQECDPPYTRAQENMGRAYRDLCQDLASRGMAVSSLMGSTGGGDGRGWVDAYCDDAQQLRLWQSRIGHGVALPVRRIRPSDRGVKSGILDRDLVDQFCIHDKPLTDILKAHGWRANGKTRGALQRALAEALDRMQGPVRGGRILRCGQ